MIQFTITRSDKKAYPRPCPRHNMTTLNLIPLSESLWPIKMVTIYQTCPRNFIHHHLSDSYKFSGACNVQPEQQSQGLGLRQLHIQEMTYPSLCLAK
jgi:hypothetical protein